MSNPKTGPPRWWVDSTQTLLVGSAAVAFELRTPTAKEHTAQGLPGIAPLRTKRDPRFHRLHSVPKPGGTVCTVQLSTSSGRTGLRSGRSERPPGHGRDGARDRAASARKTARRSTDRDGRWTLQGKSLGTARRSLGGLVGLLGWLGWIQWCLGVLSLSTTKSFSRLPASSRPDQNNSAGKDHRP